MTAHDISIENPENPFPALPKASQKSVKHRINAIFTALLNEIGFCD